MERVKQYQEWEAAQKVQVRELPGIWAIDYFIIYTHDFVEVHVTKLKKDGSRNKFNSTIPVDRLMPLDAKQPTTDKNGLTAKEYAQEIFKNGYAVSDFCRTTCESMTKVLSISAAGRVKVQPLTILKGAMPRVDHITPDGHKIYSQEDRLLNWNGLEMESRGEPVTYCPRLFDGKWQFWNESKYLKVAGMKLTQLLD